MIITCPNCEKKFKIDNSLIPEEGRDLQCGSCEHVWFYKIENENSVLKLKDDVVNEVNEANQFNAKVILENNEPVNLKTLVSLIYSAKLIIANDTGPAHIASHLDKKGLVLFGSHTSAKKVSIENFNFKAISVKNLNDLDVNTVLNEVKAKLD